MTKGQMLYEWENPKHIEVYRADDHFRQHKFSVPNPNDHVDWKFLTGECKERWEKRAKTHWRTIGYMIDNGEKVEDPWVKAREGVT